MKVLKFYESSGSLKLRVDSLDDLWAVQRILFAGDLVKSESVRRFRGSERDVGELKDVVIRLRVEKTELDRNAARLRIMGKIVEGSPLEYIKLNSYHTLNIAPGDTMEITKAEWHDYLRSVIKNAVNDSKKPRLGVLAVDDEKTLPALLLGYGVEFKSEIYSHLSKRMSQKEFAEQQAKYFDSILGIAEQMDVDTIVVAGPGFTRDDMKKYWESKGMLQKTKKHFLFFNISNVERSGVYELIRSDKVSDILEGERIRQEFRLMAEFLEGLGTGRSSFGADGVSRAIEGYSASTVMVNDSVLGDESIKKVLNEAERLKVKIEIFNANDEAGKQLNSFKDIACI